MAQMTDSVKHPFLLATSILLSLPVLWQYWKWMFGGTEGFLDDVRSAAEPDWFALWKGRYWEGEWAELKIGFFVFLCGGLVAAFYKLGCVVLY